MRPFAKAGKVDTIWQNYVTVYEGGLLMDQWAVMLHKGIRARGCREEESFSTRRAVEAMQWKQASLTDEEKFQGWHYKVKLLTPRPKASGATMALSRPRKF